MVGEEVCFIFYEIIIFSKDRQARREQLCLHFDDFHFHCWLNILLFHILVLLSFTC